MKRVILIAFTILSSIVSFAQDELKELDFVGEAFIIQSDNSILKLEKQTAQIKTKATASMYLTGVGKIRSKIFVPGNKSNTRTKKIKELKIVVKAKNNDNDPLSFIRLFKFDVKRKKRLAELSSIGTFSGRSNDNLKYLKFVSEKYGENSYLLTVKNTEENAEYGLTINNPQAKDKKNVVVSTFGID